ncbi:MAG: hypothetical protein ACI9XC_000220 [Gammaproteobacteria bacterium]|jgi:hypothetical protein
MIITSIREKTCPACGHHISISFLKSDEQPLATLAWPADKESSKNLPHLPLDFVQCVKCSHIYNAKFDYASVPYSQNPNLMFNDGTLWSEFIKKIQEKILSYLPTSPLIVEIGHGDGSFLNALSNLCPDGSFIGFDPHGADMNKALQKKKIKFKNELFDPIRHFSEIKPDLIISRHVLEHLVNPLGFLQHLSFAANHYGITPITYFEVPCIDRVLETGRTVDFYYEHSSQFTSQSFKEMLNQSTLTIEDVGYGYDSEVIYSFSKINSSNKSGQIVNNATHFYEQAEIALKNIKEQLKELYVSGQKIAVWGGTGKSSAFMCRYDLDDTRFPIVIDSDQSKVGTFVPGMGQEIRFRDWLLTHPVDVIIIPPQWRAKDIIQEMVDNNISYKTILIEHNGALVDFHKDTHPY